MPAPSILENSIPHLNTARLRLRGHRIEDFANCAAMWADPVVTRYIGGRPLTQEEAWARLLRYVGHWSVMGYGFWAVEEKDTQRFVGEAGFASLKREIEPPLTDPEAGWVFARQAHGRGYATEALQAALAWGDVHLESARTACIIHPENRRSIRVAEKCGYGECAPAVYKGQQTIIYSRQRQ